MKNKLNPFFDSNIASIISITTKVYRITLEDGNEFILKRITKEQEELYEFLKNQNIKSVYPIKNIVIEHDKFYLFPFVDTLKYSDERKIYDLKDALNSLHNETTITKKLKKKNYKFLYRLYKNLDLKFKTLESLIRESEMKPIKSDFDWIILSKYHTFLDLKKIMYTLQMKIHDELDKGISVSYSLIHGKPSLSHLVNHYLVSFENARLGISISDIAKFYVENEYIPIDWFSFIDDWLASYNGDFYKRYFKFLVLYIFVLNLKIDREYNYETLNNYITIHSKIQKALKLFTNYK